MGDLLVTVISQSVGSQNSGARHCPCVVGKAIESSDEVAKGIKGGSETRLVPGTEGLVMGGSSTKRGKNMYHRKGYYCT